jgi:hypothetical protein
LIGSVYALDSRSIAPIYCLSGLSGLSSFTETLCSKLQYTRYVDYDPVPQNISLMRRGGGGGERGPRIKRRRGRGRAEPDGGGEESGGRAWMRIRAPGPAINRYLVAIPNVTLLQRVYLQRTSRFVLTYYNVAQ